MCQNSINICLSCDDNYVQHMAVVITSVLKNRAEGDEFSFIVLDGNISEENKNKIFALKKIHDFDIEFVKVDNDLFKLCPIQDWTHLSIVAYYRLIITDIKPEWDRILYLDCDVVVRTSLKELFNLDIGDNYLAAVTDVASRKHSLRLDIDKYYNTGVLVINAKKWREDDIIKKLFTWIENNSENIVLHDQDILNKVLNTKILTLDTKWNTLYLKKFVNTDIQTWEKANILHYADKKKPWLWFNNDKLANEYLYYLKFTPYKPFLYSYFLKVVPTSLLIKGLRFLFEIVNINDKTKCLRICGLKFCFNRRKKYSN